MKIKDVIAKAMTNEEFANQLREKARRVAEARGAGNTWQEFIGLFEGQGFATNPDALAAMVPESADPGDGTLTSETWAAFNALTTTPDCGVSTTTTTTTTWNE